MHIITGNLPERKPLDAATARIVREYLEDVAKMLDKVAVSPIYRRGLDMAARLIRQRKPD